MLIPYMMLGMAMGRVRGGFFYTQTRPVGPHPLPEPSPFNKQVFFMPAQTHPVGFGPNLRPKSWPNKKRLN